MPVQVEQLTSVSRSDLGLQFVADFVWIRRFVVRVSISALPFLFTLHCFFSRLHASLEPLSKTDFFKIPNNSNPPRSRLACRNERCHPCHSTDCIAFSATSQSDQQPFPDIYRTSPIISPIIPTLFIKTSLYIFLHNSTGTSERYHDG